MNKWFENNKRRNPKKTISCNITGDMSSTIIQSLPYCIQQAAIFIQDYEFLTLKNYIEQIALDNETIKNIKIVIDNDSNVNNVFHDQNGSEQNSWTDEDDDKDDEKQSILGDEETKQPSGSDFSIDINSALNDISDDNSVELDLSLCNQGLDPIWEAAINSKHNKNNKNKKNKQNQKNKQNKQTSDSDVDVMNIPQSDENAQLSSNSDINVNTFAMHHMQNKRDNKKNMKNNLNNSDANVEPKINYSYKYQKGKSKKWETFNNDTNLANINYGPTFSLANMWDFCSSWRRVYCVWSTLKFPTNPNNATPASIIRAQLWLRSAMYKSYHYADWLWFDYAMLGAVAGYMLQAFVHYSPHNYGFFIASQQLCEHFGKWMKQQRNSTGSHGEHKYLFEIATNSDLNVLARTYWDLIDLGHITKMQALNDRRDKNIEHIFEVEQALLRHPDTPAIFRQNVEILQTIKVNDPLPQCFDFFMQQNQNSQSKFKQIKQNAAKLKIQINHDEEQIDAQVSAQQLKRHKHKKQIKKMSEDMVMNFL